MSSNWMFCELSSCRLNADGNDVSFKIAAITILLKNSKKWYWWNKNLLEEVACWFISTASTLIPIQPKLTRPTFFHVTLRLLVRFSDIMFFPNAFPSFLDIFFLFLSAFLLLSSRYYYSLVSKRWISIVQPTSKCFIDFLIH